MNSLLAKPGQNSFWLLASKTQLQKARKRQKKGLLRKEDGPVPANFLILLTITPSTDQKDMVRSLLRASKVQDESDDQADILHGGSGREKLISNSVGFVTKSSFLLFVSHSLRFGEGNGNPLQYSCLENPVDRGAW